MAKGGGTRGSGKGGPKRPMRPGPRPAKGPKSATRPPTPRRAEAPDGPRELPPGPLRVGVIPGATPGKWIDTWQERMPRIAIDIVPLAVADQRAAFDAGSVDVALVRLPIEKDGLHAIALYDELTVVVCSADSHLTTADELDLDDLAGEVLIIPADDVLAVTVPGSTEPRFTPPATTEEAIATVAAGVGIVVVPMSLARLHQRKDVEYRPLRNGPTSSVAIVWPSERAGILVDTFVGIVRGRTANSSR